MANLPNLSSKDLLLVNSKSFSLDTTFLLYLFCAPFRWRPSPKTQFLLYFLSLHGSHTPNSIVMGRYLSTPFPSSLVDPIVWDTSNLTQATHATPVSIHLKDPSVFPCVPQYPKHQWELKSIIYHLLNNRFLKVTHSPYNTPGYGWYIVLAWEGWKF